MSLNFELCRVVLTAGKIKNAEVELLQTPKVGNEKRQRDISSDQS